MITPSAAGVADRLATLRQAFVEQVPERLNLLRVTHGHLPAGPCPTALLTPLSALLHELTGTAATFGFSQLSETARAAEMTLRAAVAGGGTVTPERRQAIDSQIAALLTVPLPDQSDLPPLLPPRLDRVREPNAMAEAQMIFVVDDNALLTADLATQIRYFGYEAEEFGTLDAFIAAFRTRPPAAVLMDIEFQNDHRTGPMVVGELMQATESRVPVIFMSTREDMEARLAAARAGGANYMAKPVVVTELIDRMDAMLRHEPESPFRVLVIDDSPSISQLYAGILEGVGMKVKAINDPLQAIDALAEFQPDLALVDLYMPQCTGLELASVVRQMEAYVGLPIVFLSAETDRDKQLSAMQMGADDFLTKPIAPGHLVAAVANRARRARSMRSLMVRDSLTGLLNHSSFLEAATIELSRCRRGKTPAALVMIDIDHFKGVNDTHGHPTGDRVIKSLSRQLTQRLRTADVIGRYGGEEFAVLLGGTDGKTALHILNQIREDFARITHASGKGTFTASFSAGVAAFPGFDEVQRLLDAADKGLYEAKRRGRNCAVLVTAQK